MIQAILIFFGAFFSGRYYEAKKHTPTCPPCTTRVEVRDTTQFVPIDTSHTTFTQRWLYFNKDSCRFEYKPVD